ncbi:hypothetical protein BKA83DRAFT_26402 [Pisolithus microcarpus]|nr:hypothetical protein BKA83DRAFT_26402 [Pisolithus microcarpus]
MAGNAETPDWDFVFQFVSEPLEFDIGSAVEKPVAERTEPPVGNVLGQVPTPPESFTSSPADSPPDENTLVSVSTTFFPGAQLHAAPPGPCPPLDPVVPLPESSVELNIVLHAIYDMSCSHYSPSFEAIVSALSVMDAYGISVKKYVARSTPLYNLLLCHAPIYPLELYALAASHDLYDLAVPTSSHLLSFSLASLTDDMVDRIGPRYLKRLFFLHFGRSDALKRLLLPPPHPHPPTEQKKLTRAWALASAYLAWDARPDLSTSTIESALAPLGEQLSCEQCKLALHERLKTLIVQWSVVKGLQRTI